jgi:hypothetical protein
MARISQVKETLRLADNLSWGSLLPDRHFLSRGWVCRLSGSLSAVISSLSQFQCIYIPNVMNMYLIYNIHKAQVINVNVNLRCIYFHLKMVVRKKHVANNLNKIAKTIEIELR